MGKHTPGSWSVETGVDDRNEPCFFIRAEPREVSVPVLGSREWAPILAIVRREEGSISDAEFKGNARLISAAPELLGAAIRAVRGVKCIGTDENNDTCGVTFTCRNCHEVAALVEAIAKAEGR